MRENHPVAGPCLQPGSAAASRISLGLIRPVANCAISSPRWTRQRIGFPALRAFPHNDDARGQSQRFSPRSHQVLLVIPVRVRPQAIRLLEPFRREIPISAGKYRPSGAGRSGVAGRYAQSLLPLQLSSLCVPSASSASSASLRYLFPRLLLAPILGVEHFPQLARALDQRRPRRV